MKKVLFIALLLPVLAVAQFSVSGGGSLDLDELLPIIADSAKWTDGSTVNSIKPRDAKTVEADSGKFGALEVTGNTILGGNLTMVTTATEQVKLGTGSDAAPELSSAGDTDTGIRFTGGNKMQLVQGGLNSHTFRPYRYTMRYSDGDTLGLTLDGTSVILRSNTQFDFIMSGVILRYTGGALYSSSTTIGVPATPFTKGYFGNYLYLGGKGKTATQYISTENTIAGQDSSIKMMIAPTGDASGRAGNPVIDMKSGYAGQNVRQQYFGPDTLALFNGAKTGRDSTVYVLPNGSLCATGASTFGATATPVVLSTAGKVTAADSIAAGKGIRSEGPALLKGDVTARAKAVIYDSARVNLTSKLIGNVQVGTGTNWFTAADSSLAIEGDISIDGFKVSAIDTVFTATYAPRWVKFTSGAKSWYSPVYADTTGKW